MSETLPYVEMALKIETTSMNNTHMGTVVECMTLDMEYEGAKFNLHQNLREGVEDVECRAL